MTLLAVAGGTGQAGSAVVREALARGYEVRSFSRRLPAPAAAIEGVDYVAADAATGEGLAAALDGAHAVVDALEGRGRAAQRVFPEAGRRLLAAAHGSGLQRAVMLSIAQCDQAPFGYYRSKVAKEEVYDAAKLPTVVVRAAQFHSLLAEIFAYGSRLHVVASLRGAQMQPIDVADVARALVDAAAEELPGHLRRTVSGPETKPVRDFAQEWRTAVGSTARILDLPMPVRFFSQRRNIAPGTAFGTTTFAQWLEGLRGA
ncbi:SDR family oxidoreductase [Sinomonas terrae]|uniref:NAD(P)H-binding protein n=1 Tax=Sinomonas terrae TaxID=2908838 RepID=A0ABS9TYD0_9MICC|nr:NAD(P)H-binding protein [Sinomonas terrae]MCH6469446.1 NAD(P)H-binding protein [Sinomonas terrae]